MVAASLQVKKRIVENDEFEIDIRRSMNYGHSIGHAIEALSEYRIPHGVGVAIGILVENRIALNRGLLPNTQEQEIYQVGRKIIPENIWKIFSKLSIERILPYLASDKKVEGAVLKLATLQELGKMVFVDLPLNSNGMKEVKHAFDDVILKGT